MWLRAAVMVLSGVLVYANGLSSPFMLDDENSIINNPTIRQVWPPTVPLSPPRETPVAGRPLVNFTFALDYAASGLDVRAYRVVNLAVHLISALVLFGIIRRTLLLAKLEPVLLARHVETEGLSLNLSFACALIWAIHPLNTEVVNYVSQRTEALMGLFYFLTLYCAIRGSRVGDQGTGGQGSGSHTTMWQVAAVASCAAGMACKESMVTAPAIVALYDRVFLFDSMKDTFRRRWRLYAGLLASWFVLAALMSGQPRTSTGFGSRANPWVYFLNQIDIIVHYLRLTVWPRALVLDYGLPQPLAMSDVILPAAILITLGVATLVALRYRPLAGFLGAWFFITLAPTSSFVPIATEVGAERRMYLPLAGLVVLVVIGSYCFSLRRSRAPRGSSRPERESKGGAATLDTTPSGSKGRRAETRTKSKKRDLRVSASAPHRAGERGGDPESPRPVKIESWLSIGVLSCVCVLLALGTMARNREYRSRLSIAQTDVDRRPHGRSHFHLGAELVFAGQHERALEEFRISARDYPGAHYALATELAIAGDAAETAAHAREFIRLMPNDTAVIPARELLARALATQGQLDAAAEQFTLLIQQAPSNVTAHLMLGDLRLGQRRVGDAIAAYEAAARWRPGDPDVLQKLGVALAISGRTAEAVRTFELAVAARPSDPGLLTMLGRALAADGRFSEAAARFRRVLELTPRDAQAARNLALAEKSAAK